MGLASSPQTIHDENLSAIEAMAENRRALTPMQTLLEVMAGPWTLYLSWTLLKNGRLRFSELRRRIPDLSSKVLTDRLRMLEREGFVVRRCEPSIPPRVSYEPTSRLRELTPALESVNELALRWYSKTR
jgi:DNA-binding HxlR family transcriptional regulator